MKKILLQILGLGILFLLIDYLNFEKKPYDDNAIFLAKKNTKDYGHQDAFDFKHLSTHKVGDNYWRQIVSYRMDSLKCEIIINVDLDKEEDLWIGRGYTYKCI